MTKKPTKKKMGRPTRFTSELKLKAEKLSRRGFTDKEVAEFVNINEISITRWKHKHPDFSMSLKMWKESSNEKVKLSLFERACGYSHAEDKIFNDGGEPMIVPTIKHYPPDTTACIFWLKNRLPEEWRDRNETVFPGKDGEPQDIGMGNVEAAMRLHDLINKAVKAKKGEK